MTPIALGTAGGLFALLAFNHFFVDWIFQTHREAMNKSDSWRWRARHCLVYTIGFLPAMWLMGYGTFEFTLGCATLFLSHFLLDTYIPVYLWAKHIRQMPGLKFDGVKAFKSAVKTPLGIVMAISVDQILHLSFLWVLVALAVTR